MKTNSRWSVHSKQNKFSDSYTATLAVGLKVRPTKVTNEASYGDRVKVIKEIMTGTLGRTGVITDLIADWGIIQFDVPLNLWGVVFESVAGPLTSFKKTRCK